MLKKTIPSSTRILVEGSMDFSRLSLKGKNSKIQALQVLYGNFSFKTR